MNKYLSKLIDSYALYQLHKHKSKDWQFERNLKPCISIEEINEFYPQPGIPSMGFEPANQDGSYIIGQFNYKSEVDNGSSNKLSTGVYYENRNRNQELNAILVHGWRSSSHDRIKSIYLKPFMQRGYNIYSYTLPYHLSRDTGTSLYNGEYMISANVDRTLLSVKQAVTDLRALISWIRGNRKGKIVLIGISLGGLIANLASAVDDGFDGLVSIFSPNNLAHSMWYTIPGKYIKKDFEGNGFTYGQLAKHWAIINPSLLKPVLPKEKMLLMTAVYDQYIDFEDADVLWKAWAKPNRKLYRCGHSGIALCRGRIARDTFEFIDSAVLPER